MENNHKAFFQKITNESKFDFRCLRAALHDQNKDQYLPDTLKNELNIVATKTGQNNGKCDAKIATNIATLFNYNVKTEEKLLERNHNTRKLVAAQLPDRHKNNAIKTTKDSRLEISHATRSHSENLTNLWFISVYAKDIYDYLLRLELMHPIEARHLSGQTEITADNRATLIDWLIEVQDSYKLMPETFYLAVNIIDRYLQDVRTTKVKKLQLVGVSSLAIAMKYEQNHCLSMATLSFITADAFTAKEIVRMERVVLRAISFQVSSPTPIQFLRRYTSVAKVTYRIHNLAKYFMELATIEYELASCVPSVLAAAALFLSLQLLSGTAKLPGEKFNDNLWTSKLQHCARLSARELHGIAAKMASLVRNSPKHRWLAAYRKYQSKRYIQVSLCSELSGDWLKTVSECSYGN